MFNLVWVTSVTTGPNNAQSCGTFEIVSWTLNPLNAYLTTVGNTGEIDFNSETARVGDYTMTVVVRAANYNGATDPTATLVFELTAFDPCNDADALTLDNAYINSLG